MEQKIIDLLEPISNYYQRKPVSISTIVSYNTSPEMFTYRFPTPIEFPNYNLKLLL